MTWIASASPPGGGTPDLAVLDSDGRRLAIAASPTIGVDDAGEQGQLRTAHIRLAFPELAARVAVGPDLAHAGFVVPVLAHAPAPAESAQFAWVAGPHLVHALSEPIDGAALAIAAVPEEIAFEAPAESPHDRWVRVQRERLAAARAAGFTFRNHRPGILMDPADLSFEDFDPRWVATAPRALAQSLGPTPGFDARKPPTPTAWRYPLAPRPDGSARVAILGDFGTGLYYSRYIALQAASEDVDAVIHLGDVYAAGRDQEVEDGLRFPLAEAGLLGRVPVYALPANHELYARGGPSNVWGGAYLHFLETTRSTFPIVQKQENSSFVVDVGATHRLVGIDTDWGRHGRIADGFGAWLLDALDGARTEGRTTVLLTQNEPYDLDKSGTTKLWKDLVELKADGKIDLWLWGDVHYAAIFQPSAAHRFWGCCAGHAGHPNPRLRSGHAWGAPVQVRWVEDAPRFPEWTDVRQDQLANGFCTLDLRADKGVTVRYVDWMGNRRAELRLDRPAGTSRLVEGAFQPFPVPGPPGPG